MSEGGAECRLAETPADAVWCWAIPGRNAPAAAREPIGTVLHAAVAAVVWEIPDPVALFAFPGRFACGEVITADPRFNGFGGKEVLTPSGGPMLDGNS